MYLFYEGCCTTRLKGQSFTTICQYWYVDQAAFFVRIIFRWFLAANDIPYGTKVYVRQLDGIQLPNKLKHNGCVRVDDVSWSFGGNHIDFYVLEKSIYERLSPFVDGHVDIVTDTNCIIQSY